MSSKRLLFFGVLAVFLSAVALAAPITVTLNASESAVSNANAPARSFYDALGGNISSSSVSQDNDFHYARFDLSSIPNNANIISAAISFAQKEAQDGKKFGLKETNIPWNERSTYSNQGYNHYMRSEFEAICQAGSRGRSVGGGTGGGGSEGSGGYWDEQCVPVCLNWSEGGDSYNPETGEYIHWESTCLDWGAMCVPVWVPLPGVVVPPTPVEDIILNPICFELHSWNAQWVYSSGGLISGDATAIVRGWLDKRKNGQLTLDNYGIGLIGPEAIGSEVYFRNSAFPPRLMLTYELVQAVKLEIVSAAFRENPVAAGTVATMDVSITNNGTQTSEEFGLSVSDGTATVYSSTQQPLAVGETRLVQIPIQTSGYAAGARSFTVYVGEPSEGKSKTVGLTVNAASKPDLVVESAAFAVPTVLKGKNASLRFTVRNSGTVASSSTTAAILKNDVTLTTVGIEALQSGQAASKTVLVDSSQLPTDCSNIFVVFADNQNTVSEINESAASNKRNATLCVTLTPMAELSVEKAVFNPASVAKGASAQLEVEVKNNSEDLDSGAFAVGVYSGTTLLATGSFASLAKGQASSKTISVPTASLAVGQRILTAFVDNANAIQEYDETNNKKDAELEVKQPATVDLEIPSGAVFKPKLVVAGSTASLDFSIKNSGSSASGAFRVCALKGGTEERSSITISNLAPGESLSGQRIAVSTSGLAQGKHEFSIKADCDNLIPEIGESNNGYGKIFLYISSIRLEDVSEIELENPVFEPGTVEKGQNATLRFRLSNLGGKGTGSFKVGLYRAGSTALFEGAVPLEISLKGSETTEQSIVVKTSSLSIGRQSFTLVADYENKVSEIDKENNGANAELVVRQSQQPELEVVSAAFEPSRVGLGASATFGFEIRNNGAAVNVPFKTELRLGQKTIQGPSIGSLGAGAVSLRKTIAVDTTGMQLGLASFTFVADSDNQIEEADEENNKKVVPLEIVLPFVDLNVDARFEKPAVLKGLPAKLLFSVKNNGSSATKIAFKVSLLQGAKAVSPEKSFSVARLDAGEAFENSFSIDTTGLQEGDVSFTVFADKEALIEDINRENNKRDAIVSVVKKIIPDIVVEEVKASQKIIQPGEPLTITAKVSNQGNLDAGAFDVELLGNSKDWSGRGFGSQAVEKLAAAVGGSLGETKNVSYNVQTADLLKPAKAGEEAPKMLVVEFRVFADSKKAIEELDENNNQQSVTVTVTTDKNLLKPDLAIGEASFATASGGISLEAAIGLSNDGYGDAKGFSLQAQPVAYSFCDFSPDIVVSHNSLNSAKKTIEVLGGGKSAIETIAVDVSTLGSGFIELTVTADKEGLVEENNKKNNEKRFVIGYDKAKGVFSDCEKETVQSQGCQLRRELGGKTISEATDDSDGDGISNARECELKSNPLASDTDDDSVSDAQEIEDGTDPTNPKSNLLEVKINSNVALGRKQEISLSHPKLGIIKDYKVMIESKGALYRIEPDETTGIASFVPKEIAEYRLIVSKGRFVASKKFSVIGMLSSISSGVIDAGAFALGEDFRKFPLLFLLLIFGNIVAAVLAFSKSEAFFPKLGKGLARKRADTVMRAIIGIAFFAVGTGASRLFGLLPGFLVLFVELIALFASLAVLRQIAAAKEGKKGRIRV